jgi:prevent-host-death family protein
MSAIKPLSAAEPQSVASATITATEFKAKCLDILDRLASHEIETLTITKRGKPVAVLTPPPEKKPFVMADLFGSMRGSIITHEEVDLTLPVFDEEFDAELGILHR